MQTLQPLLVDAYLRCDPKLGPALATQMEEGNFDITGPDGTTIMSSYWDIIIKPETEVKVTARAPEPSKPHVIHVGAGGGHRHRDRVELRRTKSGKAKKRESTVMFGELPAGGLGGAPPPPPSHHHDIIEVPEGVGGIEIIEEDSTDGSIVNIGKKKKKPEKPPGMIDILFGRSTKKKR